MSVSDAAAYMVSSMKDVKLLYLKMVHVTCVAHGLYRVAGNVWMPLILRRITLNSEESIPKTRHLEEIIELRSKEGMRIE